MANDRASAIVALRCESKLLLVYARNLSFNFCLVKECLSVRIININMEMKA